MRAALTNEDPFDLCATNGTVFQHAHTLENNFGIHRHGKPNQRMHRCDEFLLQDIMNCLMQRLSLSRCDGIRDHQWMHLCNMQCLICVDVSKSGDERLIQQ